MANTEANPQKSRNADARQPFHRRHPRRALLLVNLVGLLVLGIGVEVGMRVMGYRPGWLEWGWSNFEPLPEGTDLTVSHSFYTDSLGIWVASDSEGVHAPEIHVNSWGFRGPEFQLGDSTRHKVMLIGDSFTWGATATPIDSSFADLIRLPQYQILNFGIPGADPDQYAAIARHYLPLVQPDAVCLFFYMANDRMQLPQTVALGQSRYHITNAGWLNPFVDGAYSGDAQATYDYFVQRFSIPRTNFLNRALATTVIGTQLWRVLVRLDWISEGYAPDFQAQIDAARKLHKAGPYSGQYMQEVVAACERAEVPLRIFFIPTHNDIRQPSPSEITQLFVDQPVITPGNLGANDYNPRPDGHFNNGGHRKMADCVLRELAKLFPAP